MRIYLAAVPGKAGVPLVFGLVGNPDFQTEQLTEMEGGYRFQVGSSAAFDVAVFRGSYDRLATMEPIAPVIQARRPSRICSCRYRTQTSSARQPPASRSPGIGCPSTGGGSMVRIRDFT